MKKIVLLIISLINTAITAVFIGLNPNELLPSHYNANGVVDAYSSKWLLLLIPCILVLLAVFYLIYAKVKEKDEDYQAYQKYAERCIIGIFAFLFVVFWIMLAMVLKNLNNIGNIFLPLICIVMGCMFVYIFNLMPKIKQNSILGIRTQATLNSKEIWKKVHRFAAYLGVSCGLIIVALGLISLFIPSVAGVLFFITLIIILISAIVPTIYSEVLYSKENKS